jgi:tRNA-dihydrouridine synthase B
VVANGDITSPRKARAVLAATGADAVMIGRAAQGRPWIFRELAHYLTTGQRLPEPDLSEVRDILLGHLDALYAFYGEEQGLRIARKHLGWYAKDVEGGETFRSLVNAATTAEAQTALARDWFAARVAGLTLDRAA